MNLKYHIKMITNLIKQHKEIDAHLKVQRGLVPDPYVQTKILQAKQNKQAFLDTLRIDFDAQKELVQDRGNVTKEQQIADLRLENELIKDELLSRDKAQITVKDYHETNQQVLTWLEIIQAALKKSEASSSSADANGKAHQSMAREEKGICPYCGEPVATMAATDPETVSKMKEILVHKGVDHRLVGKITPKVIAELVKRMEEEKRALAAGKVDYCTTCGAPKASPDAQFCVKCGSEFPVRAEEGQGIFAYDLELIERFKDLGGEIVRNKHSLHPKVVEELSRSHDKILDDFNKA